MTKKRLVVERDPSRVAVVKRTEPLVFECNPHAENIKALNVSRFISSEYTFPDFAPIEESDAVLVDTLEALVAMSADLSASTVIGVDLESHTFLSYHGLTCVLQLSTPKTDYVVDTIVLREHIGGALAAVFSDASVLKIFHGAQCDLAWLQRDFGVFVVGYADTYFASRALGCPANSLAALLAEHCGITVDKTHQMSDWRVRPLPADMIAYARGDTHYLPALWSRMAALLGAERTAQVLQQCAQSSVSALYRPEVFVPTGWRSLLSGGVAHGGREMAMAAALWRWRDRVARAEDVSPPAVLSRWDFARVVRQPVSRVPQLLAKNVYATRHMSELMAELGAEEVPPAASTGHAKTVERPQTMARVVGPTQPQMHIRFADSSSEAEDDGAESVSLEINTLPVKDTLDTLAAMPFAEQPPAPTITQVAARTIAKRTVRVPAATTSLADAFGSERTDNRAADCHAAVAARMGIVRAQRASAALVEERVSEVESVLIETKDEGLNLNENTSELLDSVPQLKTPAPESIVLVAPGSSISVSSGKRPAGGERHKTKAVVDIDVSLATEALLTRDNATDRRKHYSDDRKHSRPKPATMRMLSTRSMSFRK